MKKNFKKFLYYSIIILCFTCLISCIFLQATYYHFNAENVKNNIKLITSDKFEGRLTGSNGDYKASSYIENSFKSSNLIPLNNSYRESFEVTTPEKNNTIPKLITKHGNIVLHNYKYGLDFKDDMINYRTSNITFTKEDDIDIFQSSFLIKHEDKKYLFYVSFDKNFNFRSSFNANSIYEFSVAITTDLYNDILNSLRDGNTVTVSLPYTLKSKETSNIIGVLKGTYSSLPPLIICAHFDHLGIDALENQYSGALDNASGTAFMLELSKSLSSFIKPNRDIIFVGLTGEEFGFLGSKKFVDDYKDIIKDSEVINFDMIGAPNKPISLMTGSMCKDKEDDSTSDIVDSLKSICAKKGFNYDVKFEDCSDHASFSKNGIDAVTICHSDLSRIHTPNDTYEYIDTNAINTVYFLVQTEIYDYAYNKFALLLYNTKTLVFLSILLIAFVIFPYFYDKLYRSSYKL